MKLHASLPHRELCSRMHVCVSIGLLPQMTSHLCLLILSGLAVSSQLGLEDVFFSPQDQTVREGEGVFFQCVSGESSPAADISWLKDGKVVTRGRQIQGEFGGGQQKKTSGTLHLFNVTLEDDGVYVCVTHNPLLDVSKRSKPARLTVQGIPRRLRIIQGPNNITVAMGTKASMHCAVRGFPVPIVRWFKDGCLLTNCSFSFSLQNNGQLLTFSNVTKEEEGSYHCEASNQKETITSQAAFLLPAEMDWSFVQQPSNLTVKRGENITVTCRPPHSRPAAQVSWFKDNQLLSPTGHITVLHSGDLFFHSVQSNDSGSYFCRASNIYLQRFLTSRRASLTVLESPSVRLWPQLLTVTVGARVMLECQVSGHPSPSISWMKRGHSKQTGGRISMGQRNATLLILSARSYDEGVYVCEASNTMGQSHSTAMLRVTVSPIIVTFKGHVSCSIGASVVLPCRAVGIQPILYTWTRGGTRTQSPIMSPTEHRYIDEDGALHISRLQHSDAGEYYCTAENRAGRHQRRVILTITAKDHPADRGKQTRLVLSASNNTFSGPVQHLKATRHPYIEAQHKETTCSSSNSATTFPTAAAEPKIPPWILSLLSKQDQPTTHPTQPLVTQMQPPILPPPPHPNFQSMRLPVTMTSTVLTEDLGAAFQHLHNESLRPTSAHGHLQHKDSDEMLSVSQGANIHAVSPVSQTSQPSSKLPVGGLLGFLKLDLYTPTTTQSHAAAPQASQSPPPITLFHSSPRNPSSAVSQTPLTHPQQSFTLRFLPKFHLELSTLQLHLPSMKPSQPSTAASQPQSESSPTQRPPLSFSTLQPPYPDPPTPELEVNQLNATQQGFPFQSVKSANDTALTNWLKRNTSQSPMSSNDTRVTQQSPSWLPMLEKHDIPIVVGVGVSLAFIFITVIFYSVVQKNEPAPTSRAGQSSSSSTQRKLGVPIRHDERRSAGRTYENRAFEDDDCVAVIEQSPNTSDTRARPPGPSLVTVQMEPTFEELQEDNTTPTVDKHSVTVETYPEPIVDTKIDPCLEDEKGCSLSQPSIQLQCAEDWTSNRGDNHSPCQDALPPPSSLPSCSPSPSPPSRREEGLHSSLTLHSAEPCVAPIHHSLSISHGSPPLLLSHHVSLGLTTVAVDVHFYPTATASMAASTSTHIHSVSNATSVTAPLFSPPLVTSQDSNQSTARFHQSK